MTRFLRTTFFGLLLLVVSINSTTAQNGLKAEFYDGVNFDRLVAVKFVDNIDNYWYDRPPVQGVNPHECSIRWSGKLIPGKSGNYLFSARVDDGIRVWIDNKLIIDQWGLNDVGIFENSLDLVAGQAYTLKVEYFNALLEGEVRLLWQIPGVEKEKTWSEYFFGGYDPYSAIPLEYLFHPDEIVQPEPIAPPLSPTENTSLPEADKKQATNRAPVKPISAIEPEASNTTISPTEAEKFIPKNIEFERAKTTILESSIIKLDIFAQFMQDNPGLSVEIEGHTDPVGDAVLNLKLSKQRAYKVANYLANKGIDRKRISAEGFGGSRPLVVPKKGAYHPANRRVVFLLDGFE